MVTRSMWIGALVMALACGRLAAQSPPTGERAYVEEMVTQFRPVQRHVVVPVREYRVDSRVRGWWNPFAQPQVITQAVPVTRWEERIETSYVPETRRQYRAVLHTSGREPPPLRLAPRPAPANVAPLAGKVDDLTPVGALDSRIGSSSAATPSATSPRTSPAPATTLAPRELRPR